MPIKPENRHRYPPNWREIRAAILDRAGDRCERCGVPNHIHIIRRNLHETPYRPPHDWYPTLPDEEGAGI